MSLEDAYFACEKGCLSLPEVNDDGARSLVNMDSYKYVKKLVDILA